MIEYDEDGLPVVSPDPVPVPEHPLTFQQRLYGALVELADIIAKNDYFTQPELVHVINKWSTDSPISEDAENDPEGVVVGLDQMKLFHAIGHQDVAEEMIEEHVLKALKDAEEAPDYESMDQIDYIIFEQERELQKSSTGVAYMTAVANGDSEAAHQIIDEEGCSLTHLITQWFFMYMMSHEANDMSTSPIDAVRKRISLMGMENAKALALPVDQRRAKIEESIEDFKRMTGFYDQEDGDGDAPL